MGIMSKFLIEDFKIDYIVDSSELKDKTDSPVFIEGLLGVGHVGVLSANHLLKELNFDKIAHIYSPHFNTPFSSGDTPGVVYSKEGTAKLHSNELFYNHEHDLFVYRGFYQGDYCEFYYTHANMIMEFCIDYGVKEVYTLGGLGTGRKVKEPSTRAVITSGEQSDKINPHARILRGKENMPSVTGLSGLLIGLADKNGIDGVSLLGETYGPYPDALAAKSVLKSLSEILELDLDLSRLDDLAEELDEKREEFKKKMKTIQGKKRVEKGDRRYIG